MCCDEKTSIKFNRVKAKTRLNALPLTLATSERRRSYRFVPCFQVKLVYPAPCLTVLQHPGGSAVRGVLDLFTW